MREVAQEEYAGAAAVEPVAPSSESAVEDVSLDGALPSGGASAKARVSDAEWEAFTQAVKQANPIEDIVGLDAQLVRKGDQLVCSSPLPGRSDSTPSFFVTPLANQGAARPPWHDFGSGQSGDVISYVMLMRRLTFVEARAWLADRAGIKPPHGGSAPATAEEAAAATERELVERIWDGYVTECCRGLPDDVRAHLRGHYGLTDKTIEDNRIGFDDGNAWWALKKRGFDDESLFKSGLFPERAPLGTCRFATRIVIPYLRRSRVVYLIGRATKFTQSYPGRSADGSVVTDTAGKPVVKEPHKYIKLTTNTDGDHEPGAEWKIPSSISKAIANDWFFGEDDAAGKPELLLVAEGVMDAIAVQQAGFNCISPVTTQFAKRDQPKLATLARAARTVVLIPDQEDNGAGMLGATSTAEFLAGQGVDVRVAILPHAELKAAAATRQATARAEIVAAAGDPTEEVIAKALRKAGAWKTDANEFLAATPDTRGEALSAFKKLVEEAPTYIEHLISQLPDSIHPSRWDELLRPIMMLIAKRPSDGEREAYVQRLRRHGRVEILRALFAEVVAGKKDDASDEPVGPELLISSIEELGLFRIVTGRVFVRIDGEAIPTDSGRFFAKVANRHRTKHKRVATKTSIETALLPLLGGDIPAGRAPVRYADDGSGGIYVDMGVARRAIHITKTGVSLIEACPVAFYRPDGSLPMPTPEFPADDAACAAMLEQYRMLLRLDGDGWASSFTWLLSSMRPEEWTSQGDGDDTLTPYVALILTGAHGSGKTSQARFFIGVVDPRIPDVLMLPDSLDDLAIIAENTHVLPFDNLDTLRGEQSNALCRISTGDGVKKRSLYSNRDLAVFRGSRPILMTGITDIATRADLLDRAMISRVHPREKGKTMRAITTEFRAMRAAVFGSFCHCMSRALAERDDALTADVRMLDAYQLATAAETPAGLAKGAVLAAFMRTKGEATTIAREEPLVQALVAEIGPGAKFEGETETLRRQLTSSLPDGGRKLPRGWPETARGLTAALKRLQPALIAMDFTIAFPMGAKDGPANNQRYLRIARGGEPTPPPAPRVDPTDWDAVLEEQLVPTVPDEPVGAAPSDANRRIVGQSSGEKTNDIGASDDPDDPDGRSLCLEGEKEKGYPISVGGSGEHALPEPLIGEGRQSSGSSGPSEPSISRMISPDDHPASARPAEERQGDLDTSGLSGSPGSGSVVPEVGPPLCGEEATELPAGSTRARPFTEVWASLATDAPSPASTYPYFPTDYGGIWCVGLRHSDAGDPQARISTSPDGRGATWVSLMGRMWTRPEMVAPRDRLLAMLAVSFVEPHVALARSIPPEPSCLSSTEEPSP